MNVNDAPVAFATRVPFVQEPNLLSWLVSTQDAAESYSIRGSEGSTRAVLTVSGFASPWSCVATLLDRLAETRDTDSL